LSFSVWVKADVATSSAWRGVFDFGNRGTSEHLGVYIAGSTSAASNGPNQFNFTLWGNDLITGEAVEANRWYHLAGAYTAATKTRQFYVDGILKGTVTTTTGMFSSLDPANPPLTLGTNSTTGYSEGLAGDISNFKLYKAALEASEVQKLYRLGRTGRSMVISDTAVGIGKVPEAQLDVRGSGGFTGDLTVGGNMNNYQYWFRGNRNGQNTNGSTTGSLLVIQYDSIAGSYTSAWTGSNAYNCPVAGVYMVHGGLLCFPNSAEAGFMYVEVRRYNSAGAQLDAGSANDMHTPYRDNAYQSYHFQQTHLCNKGDRLQIILRGNVTDAHLDLHSGWGPLSIYKIG
jgi:hypothetical protein